MDYHQTLVEPPHAAGIAHLDRARGDRDIARGQHLAAEHERLLGQLEADRFGAHREPLAVPHPPVLTHTRS